ncbi:autotransporter domain-containing protein [Fusobacterium pseudoperiodonticum]|uniref:autotransporter outer membrane beta-barrel domain-containing protein n=1 Tax=Fusobacterium pseudoperiodonticum TaxID=2663009 RepID=UPI000C1C1215|nr:autotransporter outer membrane beta-barrel domain-containing protein [Fusobacterium pseudoperiodonticum]ATV72864.1 autotransporter domain-containing protein [Fusobacterium pseudoperiodonticum]
MKEQIEKMLKRNLKRKLAITTATLIAFLLSANLAFAGGDYEVGNEGIKRKNSGTLEEATENLKKTGLFKIEAETIENRLKDWSTIKLQNEVNKTFINKGKIYLINEGIGKIENRGYIEAFLSINTASNILNSGYIDKMASDGNIYNKGYIKELLSSDTLNKGISIENEGTIGTFNENKKLKNFGDVAVDNRDISSTEKIENYGLINFETGDYDTLKSANKTANKGIVLESYNLREISPNSTTLKDDKGRLIKNYANSAIDDTEINNGILNVFNVTMDKNLEVKNNSVFNIYKAKIEDNKKISFNNSTLNMSYTLIKNGIEMEFKNNSNIGNMKVIGQTSSLLKKLTIDNTTNVGSIMISDVDIEAINLVANEDIVNKNMVLRINDFETSPDKNVNTFVSTNVDLLGNSTTLGNITVKDGGRLTIGESTLFKNGLDDNVAPDDYYKKDIKIEGNGKILIGIDPYDISGVKELGQGNNLTDSVKGQVDTTDPNMLLAQDQLNIDADSLLHDIVIMPKYSFNYVDGAHEVRNKYKIVVAKDLAIPLPDDKPLQVTPAIPIIPATPITPGTSVTPSTPTVPATPAKPKDYGELNAIYRSIVTADKIKEFKVYNNDELKGFYRYLRDIYVNNPYVTTIGSSLNNLSTLRDNALFEIKPNLNKWAVVGGVVYNDNETKYRVSTTEVDTKTTGAYAKGEYGLKEDTTLGLILGGTNSKTDLSTGKIKGSSAYIGAYAKKYVNNFKFALGTAVDFAEDKVKRDAIGYEGIVETSRSSAKQKSRAFDLYTELAYSKNLGNNFYIEPKFGLSYSRVRRGAVTENDGIVNLHVNSKTFNETKARVGLDLKKIIVSGNTIHNFIINTAYERILNGAKATTIKANVVGGSEFNILVPEREKGRTTTGIEYKLENKFGLLFNLKVDYGFSHGSNKKSTRFSTGLGYKF